MTNAEIIAKVSEWQSAGFVHELTCAIDSRHASLVAEEIGERVVLVCPTCGHIQDHIPACVLGDHVEKMRAMLGGRGWKTMLVNTDVRDVAPDNGG
jgi:hypothetical protein